MEKCPYCMKILFRKKNGTLACPNECDQNNKRTALSTVIDPMKDRRQEDAQDPWDNVRY